MRLPHVCDSQEVHYSVRGGRVDAQGESVALQNPDILQSVHRLVCLPLLPRLLPALLAACIPTLPLTQS